MDAQGLLDLALEPGRLVLRLFVLGLVVEVELDEDVVRERVLFLDCLGLDVAERRGSDPADILGIQVGERRRVEAIALLLEHDLRDLSPKLVSRSCSNSSASTAWARRAARASASRSTRPKDRSRG